MLGCSNVQAGHLVSDLLRRHAHGDLASRGAVFETQNLDFGTLDTELGFRNFYKTFLAIIMFCEINDHVIG